MDIVINNFQNGQSSSPYVSDGAFSKSQNLDIFGQTGIARIAYLPTAGSTSPVDLVRWLVKASNSPTIFYGSDDSNNRYIIDPTTTPHTVTKNSVTIGGKYVYHWKDKELGFEITYPKYWSGSAYANFADNDNYSSTTYPDKAILESTKDGDNRIYIASGRYIDILIETAGQDFDPANAATYEFSKAAFTLPEGYQAIGLAELGSYLIIAAVSKAGVTESKHAITTYFFWDREVASATSSKIIELPEKRMTNMLSIGSNIFVTGGDKGKIYIISESGLKFYTQIPFDYDAGKTVQIGGLGYPSMGWWNDMLLVGVSSTDALVPAGIYGVKDGKMAHVCLPSEQLDGTSDDILIGAIYPYDETTFYFAWENDTDNTYGIDKVTTSGSRVPSYNSYFESILYKVGTKLKKKAFKRLEIQLARPLQAGEGVRVRYREAIDTAWSSALLMGTRDYSTDGAQQSLIFPATKAVETIQFRVELTTGASSSNTPYILEVRAVE